MDDERDRLCGMLHFSILLIAFYRLIVIEVNIMANFLSALLSGSLASGLEGGGGWECASASGLLDEGLHDTVQVLLRAVWAIL
jgi:hypothetical protein